MKCSDKNCGKFRVVFSETKPSETEIERCVETIEESSYIFGDRVDILQKFSGLLDSTVQSPMICYACGDKVSDESFIKYVDEKKIHSIVFPTCGIDICKKKQCEEIRLNKQEKLTKSGPMRRE